MKKIILEDHSTCCSKCFDMLSAGVEVFVDPDNDVVCGNCYKETEETTPGVKKLVHKFSNPYNSCEKVLVCKATNQYYILRNGFNEADKILCTCYPSGGFYEVETPVKAGLEYEIYGKVSTTLQGGVIRDWAIFNAWQDRELELFQIKEEYKDNINYNWCKNLLLISLYDYMDINHFNKTKVKRKEVFQFHDHYLFV